ncbi:AraC family transcriptional regulator [Rhizobium sp. KAs_5_22]|uniref:helix-turn-helix transcriptional regulator n=1 Tax=Ciceribacter selenitireducens TaxID=448181 RepID=UPI000A01E173|nr:helix-turn-helix transcriptional regulator [Ciceribacter selenitireducens]PPJ48968.1 AraC family transcriptional regulator [Rhizobium sp. KAs_5_22]
MTAIDSAVDTLLRGSRSVGPPLARICSSVRIERRVLDAIERQEEHLDYHHIIHWAGEPTIVEREYRIGRFQRVVKKPGSLSLGAAGRLPAVRALTPYNVTVCVIDPAAVQMVLQETRCSAPHRLHSHLGICDRPLGYLLSLLTQEAQTGGATGALYCESIEQALISRFLAVATAEGGRADTISPLPPKALQRVLDKIESEKESNLTLAELANESGYSRAHFVKMFQAALGKTPFEYLRDQRLEKARRALSETRDDLASIASQVGFSSHSHMTRLFQRKYGISPSRYRRSS